MSNWPFAIRRDKKQDAKDETITALNEQIAAYTVMIAALNADAKEQERILAAKDKRIADLVAALQEQARELDILMQEDVSARDERIRELEHDASEYDVASDRFVQQIKNLQQENFKLEAENEMIHDQLHATQIRELACGKEIDAFVTLLRKIDKRMIRMDRYGGKEFYDEALALLKQYESASDK